MGYMMLMTACFACGRPFLSNPRKVPAYRGRAVCKGCMIIVNLQRKAEGREPFSIPADAYEPAEE